MTSEDLRAWTGRTERRVETLDVSRLRALAATLSPDLDIHAGSPVPPGWHWLYFNPMVPMQEVGADGHPHRGGFLPPVPLPRRMWAGGELSFMADLRAGDEAVRDSEIASVEEKSGKQGTLVFVAVRHRVSVGGHVAIDEVQNIVYRNPSPPAPPRAATGDAPPPALWQSPYITDEVLLFRYSALTFNGHRIHYDAPYATNEEGYPGLVVHGPLTATMLMESVVRNAVPGTGRRLARFSYRGVAPLFVREAAALEGRRISESSFSLVARKADGTEVMTARAELA